MPPAPSDVWLLTGGTGFVGGWIAREIAARGHTAIVLARPRSTARVRRLVSAVEADAPGSSARVQVIDGDVDEPLCGIRADVLDRLSREVTVMIHAAAVLRPRGVADAHRTNVEGTVAALEVARRMRALRRFVHVSSIAVAGSYEGRFYEDWLDAGQAFRSVYGRSKYEAEARVREARDLPVLIVRPGSVVGDSRTGEAFGLTTLGAAIRFFRRLRGLPRWTPLPTPFDPASRFPIVPVDHVARAVLALVDVEAPPGRTYCLVDPDAPTIQQGLDEIAARLGSPRLRVRMRIARLLVRLPLLPFVAPALRRAGVGVDFLSYLHLRHDYDVSNAVAALEPRGVVCPPFSSYLDRAIEAP